MIEDHIINIAYDRKNNTYVAYNIEYNIFVIGVCVESAVEAYRIKYNEIQLDLVKQPYNDFLLHS